MSQFRLNVWLSFFITVTLFWFVLQEPEWECNCIFTRLCFQGPSVSDILVSVLLSDNVAAGCSEVVTFKYVERGAFGWQEVKFRSWHWIMSWENIALHRTLLLGKERGIVNNVISLYMGFIARARVTPFPCPHGLPIIQRMLFRTCGAWSVIPVILPHKIVFFGNTGKLGTRLTSCLEISNGFLDFGMHSFRSLSRKGKDDLRLLNASASG